MTLAPGARRRLVKDLWPDKTIYGGIVLVIAASLGILYALFAAAIDPQYGTVVPSFIKDSPWWLSFALSAAALVLGVVGWRRVDARFGLAGAVAGIVGIGALGVTTVLAAVAAVFFVVAIREGEHANPDTMRLAATEWPDKSMMASMLSLANGIVVLGWGAAVGARAIDTTPYWGPGPFAVLALAVAILCVVSAVLLYHQHGAIVGVVGAIGAFATFGLVLVSPFLSVATLILIRKASRENEFVKPAPRPAQTAPR